MYIIETKNLCYSYDDEMALDHVNIKIKAGSITGILGGNGAGKSTLFLNLNGVLTPDSGQCLLDGEEITYNKKGILKLRKRVGIVFQDPNDQLFSASVIKDISFGAINMGLSKEEVKQRVEEAILQTGVSEYRDKPTHALSFGQKKRVAIAGVLVMKPDVIILDEPTAGLDPLGVSEILQLLLKIRKEHGMSIIIATHDIDLVPLYCDYSYVLNHGRVTMKGKPNEIFSNPALLRSQSLRLPRIRHLMEILKNIDGLPVDETASTISRARETIKRLYKDMVKTHSDQ